MAQPAISKLTSACTSIVADAAEAMSRNVANGQEMSRNVRSDGEGEKCKTNPRRLSPRQLTAIGLLLSGDSVTCAARRLRINPRTIFRWKEDPQFIAEIDRRADVLMPHPIASAPAAKVRPASVSPPKKSTPDAEEERQMREDLEWVNEMTQRTLDLARRPTPPAGAASRNVR